MTLDPDLDVTLDPTWATTVPTNQTLLLGRAEQAQNLLSNYLSSGYDPRNSDLWKNLKSRGQLYNRNWHKDIVEAMVRGSFVPGGQGTTIPAQDQTISPAQSLIETITGSGNGPATSPGTAPITIDSTATVVPDQKFPTWVWVAGGVGAVLLLMYLVKKGR